MGGEADSITPTILIMSFINLRQYAQDSCDDGGMNIDVAGIRQTGCQDYIKNMLILNALLL